MNQNKLQKSYEDAYFKYAIKNKINGDNAEKKFLETINYKKPHSLDEYQLALNKYNLLNLLNSSYSSMIVNNNIALKILGYIGNILIFFFYLMFILGEFNLFNFSAKFIAIVIFTNILVAITSYLYLNSKTNDYNTKETFNFLDTIGIKDKKQYERNISDYIKGNYNEDPKLYKEFIKASILNQNQQRSKLYNIVKKIRRIVMLLIIIITFFPFIRNNPTIRPILINLFRIVMYVGAFSYIIASIIDIKTKIELNNTITKLKAS